jgi:hypothetical protein
MRQSLRIPLRVQGRRMDGSRFQEDTVLEDFSARGGYFLLENDPNPEETLYVELKLSPDAAPGKGRMLQTRVVRNQAVEIGNKSKRGIGVVF